MQIGLVKLSAPGEELNNNFVFYGHPGTGKTVLASSFPKPLLIIDVNDRGSESIKGTEGVFVANVTNLDELYSVVEYLEDHPKKFKSVVADTISQIQDLFLTKILEEEGETSQRVWGRVGGDTKELLARIRDLPVNSVFLAQIRESKQAGAIVEAAPTLNGPQVLPSISKAICSWAYLIGCTRIRESTKTPDLLIHTVLIGPDLEYITKYRVPVGRKVPRELPNPSYASILSALAGKRPSQQVKQKPVVKPAEADTKAEPEESAKVEDDKAVSEEEIAEPENKQIELG